MIEFGHCLAGDGDLENAAVQLLIVAVHGQGLRIAHLHGAAVDEFAIYCARAADSTAEQGDDIAIDGAVVFQASADTDANLPARSLSACGADVHAPAASDLDGTTAGHSDVASNGNGPIINRKH